MTTRASKLKIGRTYQVGEKVINPFTDERTFDPGNARYVGIGASPMFETVHHFIGGKYQDGNLVFVTDTEIPLQQKLRIRRGVIVSKEYSTSYFYPLYPDEKEFDRLKALLEGGSN